MPEFLIASDEVTVIDDIASVLDGPGNTVRHVKAGGAVLGELQARRADLVILDMQIGNMGAMAVCMDLRLEEGAGRVEHTPVLIMADRRADVFLARRAGAEGWVVKPFDSLRVRRAVKALLDGGTFHDASYRPTPVMSVPVPGDGDVE
ncbi:MAG: response regulator transcription factor [Acidimicrobiales bacterium]